MLDFFNRHKKIIKWVLIGIAVRLIISFLINAPFDFFNILAISKSVADTCSLVDGFFALKRHGLEVQLYGKIFYQLTALCLKTLEKARILETQYLFDNKPFQEASLYLSKLFKWGPPLYQLISIKMLQLLFDGIFIFFFYKIAKIIKPTEAHQVLFFWALTPFLMIAPYAVFQSDFAMLTCMVAGVYFWIKGNRDTHHKLISPNTCLTFLFLGLGAVIKQVPLLLIPFTVISFSKNFKVFILHVLNGAFFYFLFTQPWDKDTTLMKQYFLFSKESTAIFNFQLNSSSVFILSYLLLLFFVLIKKNEVFNKQTAPIYLTTLLLSIIYITEDSTFLFPQFNLWIFPFLALLTLIKAEYGLLMIAPVLGFFKRAMIGVDLAGLLKPTFGYGFEHLLDYQYIVRGLFNPDLFGLFITSSMIAVYVVLTVLLMGDLFNISSIHNFKVKIADNLDLKKITLLFLSFYLILFISDFAIKTRLTILPSQNYQLTNNRFLLSTQPLKFSVNNPKSKAINGLELHIQKNDINYVDNTILKFVDENGKVILLHKINDFLFPLAPDNYTVVLNKTIKNKKFTVEIYKEKGYNTISLFEAKFVGEIIGNTLYDNPPQDEVLQIFFPKQIFEVKLRGQYEPYQMLNGIRYHINQKPAFFKIYFLIIGTLIFIVFTLSFPVRKHKI